VGDLGGVAHLSLVVSPQYHGVTITTHQRLFPASSVTCRRKKFFISAIIILPGGSALSGLSSLRS